MVTDIVFTVTTLELFGFDTLSPPGSPGSEVLGDNVKRGEVFTRSWVVETILDLVGYRPDDDLASARIVEPACGSGAFLGPIVERLSASCRAHGRSLREAADAIRAFDLLERNVRASRNLVTELLLANGWDFSVVGQVVAAWIQQADYLLHDHDRGSADFIVGNPPYIRLEGVPDALMRAYRSRCPTMGGRADIYIGFYETGLAHLTANGKLGFICADRWMRNQYGRGLRELIGRRYSMDVVLSMHDSDAFQEQVSAYPAITIISNTPQGEAITAEATSGFGSHQAKDFLRWVREHVSGSVTAPTHQAARLPRWHVGGEPWPSASPARLAMLEYLEDEFQPLEDTSTGTRVGIGVATGADRVFISYDDELDIEQDRLLPLAMIRDTTSGALRWQGSYLVNPWNAAGELVDLSDYPRLARYFRRHGGQLRNRYTAIRQPDRWYRTIDKVDIKLVRRPKLLFPDMKTTIHPVLDTGGFYPHHNLYYLVSEGWDLRVLGGLLLSKVAEAFISAYTVRMRGGTLRFQAQYLRRIRVPRPSQIDEAERIALATAFDRRDVSAATRAALRVYKLPELPDSHGSPIWAASGAGASERSGA